MIETECVTYTAITTVIKCFLLGLLIPIPRVLGWVRAKTYMAWLKNPGPQTHRVWSFCRVRTPNDSVPTPNPSPDPSSWGEELLPQDNLRGTREAPGRQERPFGQLEALRPARPGLGRRREPRL